MNLVCYLSTCLVVEQSSQLILVQRVKTLSMNSDFGSLFSVRSFLKLLCFIDHALSFLHFI